METTKGFFIHSKGDPSVGLLPETWELIGEFNFEDEDEFEHFVERLSQAFAYASEFPVSIKTFEELEEIEKAFAPESVVTVCEKDEPISFGDCDNCEFINDCIDKNK